MRYIEDAYDSVLVFAMFESFFERTMTRPADVRSAFDVIWWTSNATILPVLLGQVEAAALPGSGMSSNESGRFFRPITTP